MRLGPTLPSLASMKILIVDDDDDIRQFLRTSLELDGYTIVDSHSGEAGLEARAAFDPDLIILDQMMPGLLGTDVARRVRDDGYSGPILLFSAYLNPDMNQTVNELQLIPISKVDTDAMFRAVRGYAAELS